MTDYQRHISAATKRALGILEQHVLVPALPAATELIAKLTATAGVLDTLAAAQDLGFGTVHGSVLERRILKDRLHEMLVDLAKTARVLDPIEHSGVGGEMRLQRAASSYAALLARGRAFHTALLPVKAAFVAYGSPATIDADLLAAINALEDATDRKNSGRASHIGGTAGLAVQCKNALKLLRKIDAIVSKLWKNDPGTLAAWNAARRVERAPRKRASEVETVPTGSDAGSESARTSAAGSSSEASGGSSKALRPDSELSLNASVHPAESNSTQCTGRRDAMSLPLGIKLSAPDAPDLLAKLSCGEATLDGSHLRHEPRPVIDGRHGTHDGTGAYPDALEPLGAPRH